MRTLNSILYWSNKVIRAIGAIVLGSILLMITAGIISRYFFNAPFSWTEEVATFLMVYLCYLSAALATVAKKHIVADFFIAKAPEKFQKFVSYLSRALMMIFFIVICISVMKLLPNLTWTSAVLEIPRSYFYLPVISMSAYMFYAVVVDILNDIFPGYDRIAIERQKQLDLEKELEVQEANEITEKMEQFIEDSGAALSDDDTQKEGEK